MWTQGRWRKHWFWRQDFFEREASTNFPISLNRNILFLECSKNIQTYISDTFTLFEYILRIKIKSKCENEDDLDLSLNGPKRNGIIIPMPLIKAILFWQVPQGISSSSLIMNIRVLPKELILTTKIFLRLVLWNDYSLNTPNFRRL